MTDDQWRQLTEFISGKAIPTDQNLLAALKLESIVEGSLGGWVYRSIASCFVGGNFPKWSHMLLEKADLGMDVGL